MVADDQASQVNQLDSLTPDHLDAVLRLRDEVAASGGVSPIADHVVSDIRSGNPGRHFLQTAGEQVTGYAHLAATEPVAELLVGAKGDADSLLEALRAEAGPDLLIWTHGDEAPMNDVLSSLGYVSNRTLLQLRRPLDQPPLREPVWPADVTVREFRVGADEAAWLAVNNAAFVGHPEQAGWTQTDIEARERESWFDPAGFFLAEHGGRVVGFHWTKRHDEEHGEVYVIGVDPSMQGKRLGEALLLQGLRHLRDVGCREVLLYVESDNTGAIALYERLGFTRWNADRTFSLPS